MLPFIILVVVLLTVHGATPQFVYPRIISPECPIHNNNAYIPAAGIPIEAAIRQPLVYGQHTHEPKSINEELGKILVNKIIKNPALNGFLNQPYGNPNKVNTAPPNVVNNYFIVPKEVFDLEEKEGKLKLSLSNEEKQEIVEEKLVDNVRVPIIEHVNQIPIKEDHTCGRCNTQPRLCNQIIPHTFYNPYGTLERAVFPHQPQKVMDNNRKVKAVKKNKKPKHLENIELARAVPRKTVADNDKRFREISPHEADFITNFRRKFPGLPEGLLRKIYEGVKQEVRKEYARNINNMPRKVVVTIQPADNEKQIESDYHKRRNNDKSNLYRAEDNVSGIFHTTTETAQPDKIVTTTEPTVIVTTLSTNHFSSKHRDAINDKHITLPELGTEDPVQIVNNSLSEEDDYYPDFTSDNNAMLLGADYEQLPRPTAVRQITEENVTQAQKPRPRPRHQNRSHKTGRKGSRHRNSKRRNSHKSEIEENNQPTEKSEEIVFRIPPGLENPDFKTTRVKSNYEIMNADDDENMIKKSDRYFKNIDNKDYVKTVYASSRVVNYGVPRQNSNEETTTLSTNFNSEVGNETTDKSPSVVIATSYNYPTDYMWEERK